MRTLLSPNGYGLIPRSRTSAADDPCKLFRSDATLDVCCCSPYLDKHVYGPSGDAVFSSFVFGNGVD
ncbi:hypothetical protein HYQ45_017286 [Verticillium longisporum]|uniref:Uncharacterized protein n=2 Tax=Verticillium TaxID=1036719 RepID=A0A8I2Z2R2_VERLO|nr:hypothetical protein HYQ45_017286 [Verticillium longisporum]KAG7146956.1 hypothetical protein HYQ46_004212 [Verticillium longisporum]RXG45334.1 hypothetical protein VDGE_30086 [Verticillium dahliae]